MRFTNAQNHWGPWINYYTYDEDTQKKMMEGYRPIKHGDGRNNQYEAVSISRQNSPYWPPIRSGGDAVYKRRQHSVNLQRSMVPSSIADEQSRHNVKSVTMNRLTDEELNARAERALEKLRRYRQ